MDDQPKVEPQQASPFFYDGKAMREPIPGTVARGELREDVAFFTGKDEQGNYLEAPPVEAGEALAARGEERFGIYCAPCHDRRGEGNGILTERANVPVPSFHLDRLRESPDGYFFEVITDGMGLMPSYRYPIPPGDRWAIVAHVRALQERQEGLASR